MEAPACACGAPATAWLPGDAGACRDCAIAYWRAAVAIGAANARVHRQAPGNVDITDELSPRDLESWMRRTFRALQARKYRERSAHAINERLKQIREVRMTRSVSALVVLVLALGLALAQRTHAQATMTCPAYPCSSYVAAWVPVPPAIVEAQKIEGYRVLLDRVLVGQAVPATASVQGFTVQAIGRHRLEVKSFNASGESPPATLDFDAVLEIVTPAPSAVPGNLLIRLAAIPSPGGVQTAPFVDPAGHVWTLVGSDVLCDGARVGGPATRLILATGAVFAFVDPTWFKNSGAGCSIAWTDVGPITPRE